MEVQCTALNQIIAQTSRLKAPQTRLRTDIRSVTMATQANRPAQLRAVAETISVWYYGMFEFRSDLKLIALQLLASVPRRFSTHIVVCGHEFEWNVRSRWTFVDNRIED